MKTKFYLAAVMLLLSVNISAANIIDSGKCGDNLTYTLTDDGVLTISGTGDMNDYYYDYNKSPWSTWTIETIIIQSGVTSIGDYAFFGCSNLTSVTIPNSVTSIGSCAFEACSSLTSVTIPNSVTSIGYEAFKNCSSLTSITIPNSVTSIGSGVFASCSSLTSITIPNSVTSIGYYAFADCSSLTSITIPNSVTSIGAKAFEYCRSLTSITIPNSVTSIGYYAFADCSSLTSITIPNSVTSIEEYAFADCSSLTSVTIGNSVTSIDNYAFEDCSSLTAVHISDIAAWCAIDFGGSFANPLYYAKNLYLNGKLVTDLIIPKSVKTIKSYAFYNCSDLETLVLGQSIESIDNHAFRDCKRLTDIYCYAERVPDAYGDPFYNVSRKATLWVPANRVRNYEIDSFFGEFNVQPMSAESANTDQVVVTPDYNSADVVWPSESNADTYELVIKDKDGKEICSLIFNSNGQLQSIAFRAPAVDSEHAPQQTQASGFRFTVTGLDSGSQYSYTITAKDAAGKALQTYTGTFYTLSTTGVDNLDQDGGTSAVRKVIEEGQVKIIMPDGRKLNMQGAEVR